MGAFDQLVSGTPGSGAGALEALWRGYVSEVYADGSVGVIVPRLTGDEPFERVPSIITGLALGEGVLVGFIEGRKGDTMVIGRLPSMGVIPPGHFSDVIIDNPPTDPAHGTRKDYVDARVNTRAPLVHKHDAGDVITGNLNWARMPLPIRLPTTAHDLNSYITFGNFHQDNNAAAVLSTNYPVPLAGLLEVRANLAGTFIYQCYTVYTPNATTPPKAYLRARYNLAWSPWELQADRATATATMDGLMSKADKAKLDAATTSALGSTLVMRTPGGHIDANTFFLKAAQSNSVDAATRKDYVDGQIATRALSVHRHTYADIDGVVPTSALPPLAINEVFEASSNAAMLALVAERGDMCIRTDSARTFVLAADDPTQLVNWKQITAAGQVLSVNGSTGVVVLVKGDIGLGSVDNTSDAMKPVSAAMLAALNLKAPLAGPTFTGTVDAPMLRLSSTTDASETSTGHAFQIGPDSATNLIIDNNEIIGRNNGALSAIFMPSGIGALPAPGGPTYATNKTYVDAGDVAGNAYADKKAWGWLGRAAQSATTGELATTSFVAVEGTFNVVAGRNYAIRGTAEFYGVTAGNIAISMTMRTGGTTGNDNGTTVAGYALWSAPGATQGNVEQRIAEFTATTTGTLRIYMTTARIVGTSVYKLVNRSISLIDEGAQP